MTRSVGVVEAPRSRKSMFNDAADSEGANEVTTTTSATLKKMISAAYKFCDLFRAISLPDRIRLIDRIEITVDCAAINAQNLRRARFVAVRLREDEPHVAALQVREPRSVFDQ